jgi:hypothetical protein
MKRLRVWYCKCCGYYKRRDKHDTYEVTNFNELLCPTCDISLKKGRKIPKHKKCRHIKKELEKYNKISKMKNQSILYYSVLRNCGGKKLKLSSETKRLWKKVMLAKNKPILIKRGQMWLESLNKDIRNCDEEDYAKSFNFREVSIDKSRGGWNTPKLQLVTEDKHNYGRFKAGIMVGGVFIELNKEHNVNELKKTLLHEAVHWIDSCSKTPSNHDCYFKNRVRELGRKVRYKEWEMLENDK